MKNCEVSVFLKVQHHGKGVLICMEVIKTTVFVTEGGDESGADSVIFLTGNRDSVFIKFYLAVKAVGNSNHKIRILSIFNIFIIIPTYICNKFLIENQRI